MTTAAVDGDTDAPGVADDDGPHDGADGTASPAIDPDGDPIA